jgi:hypothetical protein
VVSKATQLFVFVFFLLEFVEMYMYSQNNISISGCREVREYIPKGQSKMDNPEKLAT